MNLIQGSKHTIAVTNLKDSAGAAVPLPPGMVPTYSAVPPSAVVFDPQNADGSQPFTIDAGFSGPLVFNGLLVYPDGDSVQIPALTVNVMADEDVSGDLAIDVAGPIVPPPPAPAAAAPADATAPAAAAAPAPADASAPAPAPAPADAPPPAV